MKAIRGESASSERTLKLQRLREAIREGLKGRSTVFDAEAFKRECHARRLRKDKRKRLKRD